MQTAFARALPLMTQQEIRSGSLSYAVIRFSMRCLQDNAPYPRAVARLQEEEGQLSVFAHREWTFLSPQQICHNSRHDFSWLCKSDHTPYGNPQIPADLDIVELHGLALII